MNKTKKLASIIIPIILILPLLVFVCFLIGRIEYFADMDYRSPDNYPDSTWSTRNEKIFFTVTKEDKICFKAPVSEKNQSFSIIKSNMFGEINIGENKYNFFIYSAPYAYYMAFISEELPSTSDNFNDTFFEYELLALSVNYKTKKHFVVEVTASKIPEIEVGEKIHFYRTDN